MQFHAKLIIAHSCTLCPTVSPLATGLRRRRCRRACTPPRAPSSARRWSSLAGSPTLAASRTLSGLCTVLTRGYISQKHLIHLRVLMKMFKVKLTRVLPKSYAKICNESVVSTFLIFKFVIHELFHEDFVTLREPDNLGLTKHIL